MDVNKYYQPKREIEAKVPHDWKKKYPDFCICELPGPGIISKDKVTPGYFNYIDDNYIVLDDSDSKEMDLYWAWGFLGVWGLIMLIGLFSIGFDSKLLGTALMLAPVFFPPAIWFFIKAYYMNREKKLIFDRQRGRKYQVSFNRFTFFSRDRNTCQRSLG